MFWDWEFWFSLATIILSVVTAATAVIAIRQTKKQVEQGNRQHLFEIRVENYLIAIGLIQLFRNCRRHWKDEKRDVPFPALDLLFGWMTNNTYLEEITGVINQTLQHPAQKEFLKKLENLREVATKIDFIFDNDEAKVLGKFIYTYQELLFSMYQYQIMWNRMLECAKQFQYTEEEAGQAVGEERIRKDLWENFDKADALFETIEKDKIEERIQEQIKINK